MKASTGEVLWKYQSSRPMVAAVTATSGDMMFTGEMTGDFLALDARNGKVVYRFNTGGADHRRRDQLCSERQAVRRGDLRHGGGILASGAGIGNRGDFRVAVGAKLMRPALSRGAHEKYCGLVGVGLYDTVTAAGLCASRHSQLYPFNSFFSEVRKRQSVPSARIFCGVLLIMPISRNRNA